MSLTTTTPSEARYALIASLMEDFAPSKQYQLLAFTDTFQSLLNACGSDSDAQISTEIVRAAILSECQ
ncbi:hypothetical protein N9R09_01150 [Porticoccaceae bacterium]|nr:hypothetical protein [Porticoccaceae bacterium]